MTIPDAKVTTLDNGIRILSENIPSLRSVAVGILVGAGPAQELETEAGLSHFAEHMAFKGTARRSAFQIAYELDSIGGKLNAYTGKEYTVFYAVVLDKHIDVAVDVLSDIVLNPLLKEEDINMERGVILEEIRMYEDTPDEKIHDLFAQTILHGHPIGRSTLGTDRTVRSFNRQSFLDYRQRLYCPDNLMISVAGNIDPKLVQDIVNPKLRSFSGKSDLQRPALPQMEGKINICNKKTEQVHLCLGTKGLSQIDEDRFAFSIMDNILGGSMSSRLFQQIREQRGLAYSVYSSGMPTRDFGLFYIYAGTAQKNLKQVVELVLEQMSKVKKEGLAAEEISRAKEQLKGLLVLALESSSSRMTYMAKSLFYNNRVLPIEDLFEKIDRVTQDDIIRVAGDCFQDKYLTLTVIGDIKDPPIAELRL
ncbi:MAG: pitrilysin family protein [Candidatus Margulisiibacteriota bacterium]